MKTIQVPTIYGLVEVRALPLDLFVIHRAILGDDIISSKTWTATHRLTGRSVGHFESKPQAREAGKAFSALFEIYDVERDLEGWMNNTVFCQLVTEVLKSLGVVNASGKERQL